MASDDDDASAAVADAPTFETGGISDMVSSVDSLPEPSSELELQQRAVIKILVERVGIAALGDGLDSADTKALQALRATGDPAASLRLQKDTDALSDELAEWAKRMIWATEAVKRRDALLERLAEAREQTAAAEERVEPLKVECAKLEQSQRNEQANKTRLEAARMACERTLVTLPAEIARVREANAALEASVDAANGAIGPLEAEQAELAATQDRLEGAVSELEAVLAAQKGIVDELAERVGELQGAEKAATEALEAGQAQAAQLAKREKALAAAIAPLEGQLSATRDEVAALAQSVTDVEARNASSAEEIAASQEELGAAQREFATARASLKQTRERLKETNAERRRLATEDASARKEMLENEEIAAELSSEIANLTAVAPSLFARRDASRSALQEAMAAVEAFEAGPLASVLGTDASVCLLAGLLIHTSRRRPCLSLSVSSLPPCASLLCCIMLLHALTTRSLCGLGLSLLSCVTDS